VADSFGYGNEASGSVEQGELLKIGITTVFSGKDYVPWSQLGLIINASSHFITVLEFYVPHSRII
jgi:hypothetical protein